jgi:DNA-binding CsgD family transcriptional regulator
MLNDNERRLLALICDGLTSRQIANKMGFGLLTIKSYRRDLLFKLDARNCAALVKIALEENLL